MASSDAYRQLAAHWQQTNLVGSIAGGLGWDQEVMMPEDGAGHRAKQLAYLAGLMHEQTVDPRVGDWLGECEADKDLLGEPTSDVAVNVREIRRAYDLATKLPADLVKKLSETSSISQGVWAKAREVDDFEMFRPHLEKIVTLLREKAACYGWAADGEVWDALAQEYEPGSSAKQVEQVFTPLHERLVELLGKIKASKHVPDKRLNQADVSKAEQLAFVKRVSAAMGFDYNAGRLDQSAHPFCSGFGLGDVRLTTKFHDNMIGDALGSTMHEAGHGMYEQNLRKDAWGLPAAHAVSMGIHESQSRLWENLVGRSKAFWLWCMPILKEHTGKCFADLSAYDCYEGINHVQPGLIRVEADEVTYSLHIMIRFEIERVLIAGDMEVADLPEVWNQKYRDYLGVEVPNQKLGCMQDIHWSFGAVGYFPSYALGNMYAAQFFEAATNELNGLHDAIACGEFALLKDWLHEKIYKLGMTYTAGQLCEHVTGKPLSADALLGQLETKFGEVYQF